MKKYVCLLVILTVLISCATEDEIFINPVEISVNQDENSLHLLEKSDFSYTLRLKSDPSNQVYTQEYSLKDNLVVWERFTN